MKKLKYQIFDYLKGLKVVKNKFKIIILKGIYFDEKNFFSNLIKFGDFEYIVENIDIVIIL